MLTNRTINSQRALPPFELYIYYCANLSLTSQTGRFTTQYYIATHAADTVLVSPGVPSPENSNISYQVVPTYATNICRRVSMACTTPGHGASRLKLEVFPRRYVAGGSESSWSVIEPPQDMMWLPMLPACRCHVGVPAASALWTRLCASCMRSSTVGTESSGTIRRNYNRNFYRRATDKLQTSYLP